MFIEHEEEAEYFITSGNVNHNWGGKQNYGTKLPMAEEPMKDYGLPSAKRLHW